MTGIEIFTWTMIAFGVLIITFGMVMAIDLNKLINKNCPEGIQTEGNFTRFKIKGEL